MNKRTKIILIIFGSLFLFLIVRLFQLFFWTSEDAEIKRVQTQIEKDYPIEREKPILPPGLDKMTDGKG